MEIETEEGAQVAAGCAMVVWQVCVVTPMWFALLFAILSANEMPVWTWGLYWAYVPARMLAVILAAFVRTVAEK